MRRCWASGGAHLTARRLPKRSPKWRRLARSRLLSTPNGARLLGRVFGGSHAARVRVSRALRQPRARPWPPWPARTAGVLARVARARRGLRAAARAWQSRSARRAPGVDRASGRALLTPRARLRRHNINAMLHELVLDLLVNQPEGAWRGHGQRHAPKTQLPTRDPRSRRACGLHAGLPAGQAGADRGWPRAQRRRGGCAGGRG